MRASRLRGGRATAAVAMASLACAAACSSGPEPPSPGARRDAREISRALGSDAATSAALERVDVMMGEQRPVAAAELIRDHAIPAAERTLAALRALEPTTDDGRILKDTVVDAYVRRIAAMRAYAAALATTEEDYALLEALRAHRQREIDVARALAEVERTARGQPPAPPPPAKAQKANPPREGETR